jgi:hypothetical protein
MRARGGNSTKQQAQIPRVRSRVLNRLLPHVRHVICGPSVLAQPRPVESAPGVIDALSGHWLGGSSGHSVKSSASASLSTVAKLSPRSEFINLWTASTDTPARLAAEYAVRSCSRITWRRARLIGLRRDRGFLDFLIGVALPTCRHSLVIRYAANMPRSADTPIGVYTRILRVDVRAFSSCAPVPGCPRADSSACRSHLAKP